MYDFILRAKQKRKTRVLRRDGRICLGPFFPIPRVCLFIIYVDSGFLNVIFAHQRLVSFPFSVTAHLLLFLINASLFNPVFPPQRLSPPLPLRSQACPRPGPKGASPPAGPKEPCSLFLTLPCPWPASTESLGSPCQCLWPRARSRIWNA